MTAIEVARLKLRCTEQERDRARCAIEDGLRTSIPDDRRLVLLRKMQIRSEAGSPDPGLRHAAMKDGWLGAIAGARHGGEDGAADANCVWFASYEEAETLLLSRLLKGRLVDAWFWKLAVPAWHERPLLDWLPECLSEAIGLGQDQRILGLVQCLIAAGAADRLVEALAGPGGISERMAGASEHSQQPSSTALIDNRESAAEAERIAQIHVASLRPELRQLIVILAHSSGEARRMVRAIIRAWLLRRSPALSLSPALSAAVLDAAIDAVTSPIATGRVRKVAPSPTVPTELSRDKQLPERQPRARLAESSKPVQSALLQPAVNLEREKSLQDQYRPDASVSDLAPSSLHRIHSAHAGLWLVVPSLIELGFPQWLDMRPSLLGEHPGGQLLHEIARHHRVDPDDPVLAAIGEIPDPLAATFWLRPWRQGLDRWLRRKVRRRLHDLVNRPGELACSDQSLIIHFPAAAADLALRRHALDRDPGWTDWLGLSIRYNFGGREDWV
jgi:hypothetical protein